MLARIVLTFLKIILNMKTSTPNFMVYGETGVYPIYIDIYCRMISFWATLVSGPPDKLFYIVYRTSYRLYTFGNNKNNKFKWFKTVKDILYNCGFSGIGDKHLFPNKKKITRLRSKTKIKIYFRNRLALAS